MRDEAVEPADDELGRRERKKRETRRALTAAAVELALRRGPDKVTVEEIADAADVSVRTFFNYFAAKEEAMVGADPQLCEALRRAVVDRPPGERPLEVIRNVLVPPATDVESAVGWMLRRAQLVRDHPSLLPRHLSALMQFETAIAEGIAVRRGTTVREDLYASVLVAAAFTTFRTTVFRWAARGGEGRLLDGLDRAFGFLDAGFGLEAPVASAV